MCLALIGLMNIFLLSYFEINFFLTHSAEFKYEII